MRNIRVVHQKSIIMPGSVHHSIFRMSALVFLTIALITLVCAGPVSAGVLSSTTTLSDTGSPVSILPVIFIPNIGQFEDPISFAVLRSDSTLFFTPDSLVLRAYSTSYNDSLDSAAIVQTWIGANPHPEIEGRNPQENTVSFFIGSESSRWYENLTTYSGLVYRNLYPGTDCVYRDAGGRIKREFIVAPGASPSKIKIHYEGITGIFVDTDGTLIITTPTGVQTESAPVGYQMIDGTEVPVTVRYQIQNGSDVIFEIGPYDQNFTLTIDPQLLYSTHLGGSDNENGNSITLDPAGNIYVTGTTSSPDFPVTKDALLPNFYENTTSSSQIFVTKLDAITHQLIYSTYLGGSAGELNPCIAVDSSGSVFLTGKTNSADFPTTNGAYSQTGDGIQDIFVTRINPSGSSLVYSTLIGGSIGDGGAAIAVNEQGNAFVAGTTYSSDFPTTPDAFQQKPRKSSDAFVLKLHPNGTDLIYSTCLGGTGADEATGIVLNPDKTVIVTGTTDSGDFPATVDSYCQHPVGGRDVFAAKISSSGSDLLYATYLGGSGDDEAVGCARLSDGSLAIAGSTHSSDFPVPEDSYQQKNYGTSNGFVARLNSTGSEISAATLLGGTEYDEIKGITVDSDGDIYVTGNARSPDFPTTNGAYQQTFVRKADAFVARLNASLTTLSYATFLGEGTYSAGTNIAAAGNDTVYTTGRAAYFTFPTTPDAQFMDREGNSDAFVAELLCENLVYAGFAATISDDSPVATIMFNATPGTPDTSWRWDFGDGTYATGQNATHTFTHPGTYSIILFAENRAGETSCIRTFEIGLAGNRSRPVFLKELPIQIAESTLSIISGEPIEVHGTAQQPESNEVRIWLFGPNTANMTEQQLTSNNSYRYSISPEISRTFANEIYCIVVQEPGPDNRFGVIYNTTSDEVAFSYRNTVLFRLSDARSMRTENSAGTLIRAITDPVSRDSCTIYHVIIQHPWIKIYPIGTAQKNTLRVSGTTNLPEGESMEVDVMTTSFHPTPKNYDYSHERAEANTTVQWVNATTRGFSCAINVSLLWPGEYLLEVCPLSKRYDVETTQIFNLLPEPSPTPRPQNFIDWEHLNLPQLTVNTSIEPVLLTHQAMLVPADEQIQAYEIPYGSIMLFSVDGIVEVFDEEGSQIAAFYDSNELHITQVPNGAMVSTEGNVTTILLGEEQILTRIHEADTI